MIAFGYRKKAEVTSRHGGFHDVVLLWIIFSYIFNLEIVLYIIRWPKK